VIKYLFELIEKERLENKETIENLHTKISGLKAELKAGQSEVNEFKERLKKLEEEYQRQIQVKTKDLTDKVRKQGARPAGCE
jgi:predicted nuclease with TOPRIM domain